MANKKTPTLGNFILSLLIFCLPHIYFISGKIKTQILLYPEFIIFASLSVLIVLIKTIAIDDSHNNGFLVKISDFLFYHGVFSISFFSLSVLGMSQWLCSSIYIILILLISVGISKRSDVGIDSDLYIVFACVLMVIVKTIVEIAIPTISNGSSENISSYLDPKRICSFVVIAYVIILEIRMIIALSSTWEKGENHFVFGPEDKKNVITVLAAVPKFVLAIFRTIIDACKYIIKSFGLVFFVIFICISYGSISIIFSGFNYYLNRSFSKFIDTVWVFCNAFIENLSISREIFSRDSLSVFAKGLSLVLIVFYILNRYKNSKEE